MCSSRSLRTAKRSLVSAPLHCYATRLTPCNADLLKKRADQAAKATKATAKANKWAQATPKNEKQEKEKADVRASLLYATLSLMLCCRAGH